MTVVETVLVLAVIPAAIYGVITLIALWPRLIRPRYRAGQGWDFAPVLWVADPEAVNTAAPVTGSESGSEAAADPARPSTARGGARGNW
ncbi:hypothetical protein IQ251_08450 [Saccharopolyspora sp. HNM0983]|uniref:Uncharacterized protein n=1 Tax=Saccharopolyspora montiporae TaxID=2781240 RepID=A0A929BB73_9PSEU|nr:hypothetical protein [Saccharopolyspora sp. HNM0983]